MPLDRVVIVGASIAGVHAAEALRDAEFGGEITLVDIRDGPAYDRPPLSKAFLAGEVSDDDLWLRQPSWYHDSDINVVGGHAAAGLDIAQRQVELVGGDPVSYDGLLLCTGSVAILPRSIRGDVDKVNVLRSLDDARRLRETLRPGSRVVVIGGGFIGLEVAAAACKRGAKVTVIEAGEAPLALALGKQAGEWFGRLHLRHGVDIRSSQTVQSLTRSARQWRVILSTGDAIAADAVVAGVGVVPATRWLSGSGVDLTPSGGVRCDAQLRSSVPGVFAAGDICAWDNRLYGEQMRVEHWTTAVEQGQYAARSMLGLVESPYVSAPYFWTDQFDAKARSVGYIKGADVSQVGYIGDKSLIVLYGKRGLLRAALCVNAPRALIACRQSIMSGLAWSEVPSLLRKCT